MKFERQGEAVKLERETEAMTTETLQLLHSNVKYLYDGLGFTVKRSGQENQ